MSLTEWQWQEVPSGAPSQAVEIRLPPVEEIARDWPVIEALLRKSTVITGCYEPIDLLRMAMAGQVGIWTCVVGGEIQAAVATEVKQYPRKRILEILFVGGSNMKAWLPALVEEMDRHATAMGCSHCATLGRKGWARSWGGKLTGSCVIVREIADA